MIKKKRIVAPLGRLSNGIAALKQMWRPGLPEDHADIGKRRVLLPLLGVLPASIIAEQAAAQAPARSDASSVLSSTSSGARADGVTDDTQKLQLLMNDLAARGGGVVQVPAGAWHYIGSDNLTIPPGVILEGSCHPFAGWGTAPGPFSGCGLYVNPDRSIVCDVNSGLRRLKIFRAGLLASPTASQIRNAVEAWGSEKSIGVQLTKDKGANVLEDLFIVGFHTLIKSAVGDFYLNRIFGDGFNGLDVAGAADNHSISRVRFEPFYGINLDPGPNFTNWSRPGIAFNNSNGCTGGYYTECFAFCWNTGFQLKETGISYYIGCGWESQVTPAAGQRGFNWLGHNAQVSFHACYSSGGEYPFDIQGTGECVIVAPSTIGTSATAHFRLGPGSYGAIYNADMNLIGDVPGVVAQQNVGNWKIISPLITGVARSEWLKVAGRTPGKIEVVSPGLGFEEGALAANTPYVGTGPDGSVLLTPTTGAILSSYPNGTVAGGDHRGQGAVDLQWSRSQSDQVASGAYSTILAGLRNRAAGNYSAVIGGHENSVQGDNGFAAGFGCLGTGARSGVFGAKAGDGGREGVFAWGSDPSAAPGTRQHVMQILGGETKSALPVRLTADHGVPTATNCVNVGIGFAYKLDISVVANSGPGDAAATWDIRGLLLRRDENGKMILVAGTLGLTPTNSYGRGSGWRIDVAADHLNFGLSISAIGDPDRSVEWCATVTSTEVRWTSTSGSANR